MEFESAKSQNVRRAETWSKSKLSGCEMTRGALLGFHSMFDLISDLCSTLFEFRDLSLSLTQVRLHVQVISDFIQLRLRHPNSKSCHRSYFFFSSEPLISPGLQRRENLSYSRQVQIFQLVQKRLNKDRNFHLEKPFGHFLTPKLLQ